ncbi:MAG TPA: hypothetical protein VMX17_09380 [Candidatus Glassbacteria bacterium]|nr:hypothetical protein [Candidatus Glassbacteria bacterium]
MKKYSVTAIVSLLDEIKLNYNGKMELRPMFDFLCTIEDLRNGLDFIDKENSDSKKRII